MDGHLQERQSRVRYLEKVFSVGLGSDDYRSHYDEIFLRWIVEEVGADGGYHVISRHRTEADARKALPHALARVREAD